MAYVGRGLREFAKQPCAYCGEPMRRRDGRKPTRDHVYPKEMGGTAHAQNVIIACAKCNHDKGNKTIQTWLGQLEASNDPRIDRVRDIASQFPALTPDGIKRLTDEWERQRRDAQRCGDQPQATSKA